MALKENIKFYRKKYGYTLEDVGTYIGVSKGTILKYENGSISNIPYDNIVKMANMFNIDPGKLMGWEKSKEHNINDDLKVALFGGDGEVTDEMWQEVKDFAEYVKQKHFKK